MVPQNYILFPEFQTHIPTAKLISPLRLLVLIVNHHDIAEKEHSVLLPTRKLLLLQSSGCITSMSLSPWQLLSWVSCWAPPFLTTPPCPSAAPTCCSSHPPLSLKLPLRSPWPRPLPCLKEHLLPPNPFCQEHPRDLLQMQISPRPSPATAHQ